MCVSTTAVGDTKTAQTTSTHPVVADVKRIHEPEARE